MKSRYNICSVLFISFQHFVLVCGCELNTSLTTDYSDIKKYLELDLGPEDEFSALRGQCFEYSDREYTYRLCPFEKTSQKPKGGGIETNLG